jgi:hypothetical protein
LFAQLILLWIGDRNALSRVCFFQSPRGRRPDTISKMGQSRRPFSTSFQHVHEHPDVCGCVVERNFRPLFNARRRTHALTCARRHECGQKRVHRARARAHARTQTHVHTCSLSHVYTPAYTRTHARTHTQLAYWICYSVLRAIDGAARPLVDLLPSADAARVCLLLWLQRSTVPRAV